MAESYFLGGLSSLTPSTKVPFALAGTAPDGYELRALEIVVDLSLKNTAAATFAVAAPDHNTILNAIFSKIRMAGWGVEDVVNLVPSELRTLAIYATSRDPATQDPALRVGSTLPASGSSFQTARIKVTIPFVHRGLETPEGLCPSTDQFNIPGHRFVCELGAGVASLALTNATLHASSSITAINFYAVVAPAEVVHFGPMHVMRQFTVTQNRHPEDGKGFDIFLADERTPATVEGQVSQITIIRDTRSSPVAVPPGVLAQQFAECQAPMDGVFPVDLTSNTLGGTAAVVTPYAYLAGDVRSTERQWNTIFRRNRTIFQNLAAGGSAAATLLHWQLRPIEDTYKELTKSLGKYNLPIASLDDLEVRGGGGSTNELNGDFKGRFLARKGAVYGRKAA